MEKLNAKLTVLFSLVWLIYLLFTMVQVFIDFQNIKRIDWEKAENISSKYTGYKATIITIGEMNKKSKGINIIAKTK